MSSETKSRAGRTAEQVVNEWCESGSQDWGQLVSAINYWAVTDMCPALESSSSADTGGHEAGLPTVDEIAEAMADAGLWKGAWKGMCEAERNVTRQRAEGVYAMLARRGADPGTTGAEGLREAVEALLVTYRDILRSLNENIEAHRKRLSEPSVIEAFKHHIDCVGIVIIRLENVLRRAAKQRAPITPPTCEGQVDFGDPDEVVAGIDRINAHNAALPSAPFDKLCFSIAALEPFQPNTLPSYRDGYTAGKNAALALVEQATPAPVTTPGRDATPSVAEIEKAIPVSLNWGSAWGHRATYFCSAEVAELAKRIAEALAAAKEPRG